MKRDPNKVIGEVFGSYRVTRCIGEGGMGTVYEAEHMHIGRKAALKVLLPAWSSNQQIVTRFFNEARSSAMAKHPGIVEIFDCGFTAEGKAYLVMELLEGQPLSQILAGNQTLSVSRMASLSRQIASALYAAHNQGIIHRDLKPDNIFVIPDAHAPGGERVKILDFGVAKLAKAKGVNTFVGVMIGTPLYMSPEQCQSSGQVDARSDIYSVGCIMFEMLCGRPPFEHEDPIEVASMQVRAAPPRPSSLRPDIPVNVESLLLRILAKDREARPQSMHDLRAELDVVWELVQPREGQAGERRLPTSAPGVPVLAVPSVLGPAAGEAPQRAVTELSVVGLLPVSDAAADAELEQPPAGWFERSVSGWRLRLATTVLILAVASLVGYLLFGSN